MVAGSILSEEMLLTGNLQDYTVRAYDDVTLYLLPRSDWLKATNHKPISSHPSHNRARGLPILLLFLAFLVATFWWTGPDLLKILTQELTQHAMESGQPQLLVAVLHPLLHWTQGTGELQDALGQALFVQGDVAGALSHFRQAVQMDENLASAHNNLGVALLAAKQPDEAVSHLQKSVSLNPGSPIALYNLGNAWLQADRPEDAATAFLRAYALDPDQLNAKAGWAAAMLQLGIGDAAQQAWENVTAADPGNALAHQGLGVIALQQGRSEDPMEAILAARDLDPGNSTIHLYLGLALETLGRQAEAIIEYKLAIALSNDPVISELARNHVK